MFNISNSTTYRNGNAKSIRVHVVLFKSAIGTLIVDITSEKYILQLATKFDLNSIMFHADTRQFQNDAIYWDVSGEKCFV